MKLITLNYWRYYDLPKRLPNILKAIQRLSPDVILFQEMQIDTSHSPFSQVETLKNSLPDYTYSIHSTIYPKSRQQGKALKNPIQHGMAVLSKHPIINSFEYYVGTLSGEDAGENFQKEPRSVLCFDVLIKNRKHLLANIHFSNNEQAATDEFDEFLSFLKTRNECRIMAGDFNLYGLADKSDNYPKYKLSSDIQRYVSYPQRGWCLDYIMIPKNYHFQDFQVLDEYLSDHFGLFAEIGVS
jgi:endonuclease/exonuclease/phosphatase family metal-dependent hydrolase